MPSALPDAGLGQPNSWDGVDATEGYNYDNDSGSSSSIENLHVSGEPTMEPGEIWQFKIRLTLSSEPTGGLVLIELRDEPSDNILARSVIPEYGGNEVVLFATIPTYEVVGESSSPASTGGRPDIRVNNVNGETFNYFVDHYAVRLRSPVDRSGKTQNELTGSTGSLDSGQL